MIGAAAGSGRRRAAVFAAAGVVALIATAGAQPAGDGARTTIEPWTRVNGMLVVQGRASRAETSLFGTFCNPAVVRPGRRTRWCGAIPRMRRLFIGYGMWTSESELDRTWERTTWAMWIDGHRVALRAFGTADRSLVGYAPAGGRDVVLREWLVTLVGVTLGRHSIRYRMSDESGVFDTTWRFTVNAA